MPKITLKINCGCGYTTDNPKEAERHVKEKGHTMDISGKIRPDKEGKNG